LITIEQIKEYTKCPQFGDIDYGKWGALRQEQREAYRHLIDIIEGQDKEIERLNNIIEKYKKHLEEYDKWLDYNTEIGNLYWYDATPFPKLELKGEDKE